MSGRLILLPKKSYTPWNPENVERVLRDERLDRERKLKEEEDKDRQAANARIETLKRRKASLSVPNNQIHTEKKHESNSMEKPEEHVNFFAKEEEAMRKQVENGLGFTTTDQKKTNQCRHESRVYLNDRPTQKKKNQTFEISEMSQQKLKREMDPMRIFLTDNDTKKRNPKDSNEKVALANTKDHEKDRLQKADNFETESEESESPCPYKKRRRRHHRHRHREHEYHHSSRSKRTSKKKRQKYDPKKRKKEKRNEVDSSNDCESSSSKDTYAHSKDSKHKTSFQKRKYNSHNSTSSSRMEATCSKFTMDELRKRRIERETMEGSRESKILSESFLSHKQKELGNDRIRMYQNQYHPTLSRKKVNY